MTAGSWYLLMCVLGVFVILYQARHIFAVLRQVKETDRAFAAVATLVLDQAETERRERELTEMEQLADLALFHADPRLAVELGYKVPVHECRWSRAYRSGEPSGPFTCETCGRPWVDKNLKRRRRNSWWLP